MSFLGLRVVGASLLMPLLWLAGCDADVSIEPNDGGGAAAECCPDEPMCTLDVPEVTECVTDQCFSVESCCIVKLCDPGCFTPVCELGEVQADTCDGSALVNCHAVTNCDNTVYCGTEAPCGMPPTCDEGDAQELSGVCPPVADCYEASLCGTIILCHDFGLQHGCPSAPPQEGAGCDAPNLNCEYPLNAGCVEGWLCAASGGDEAEWESLGVGCSSFRR